MRECNTVAEGGVVLPGSSLHRMISVIRASAVAASIVASLLVMSSCKSDGTAPADDDAMHIVLPDPDLTLTIGASGTVRVTIIRNTFAGEIRLRTEGAPSGV